MPSINVINTIHSFTQFFQENQQRFVSFAFSYIKDKEEAEDIVMESMIALWENRDKWEEGSNPRSILLTIIRNKALNHLAREQVRMRVEGDLTEHSQRELNLRISTLEACDPNMIFDSEIQHIVNKTLENLPEQSRNIFVLSRYQNTPNKAIAEQLGISIKSVEFHITKVLKVLRLELKDYLVSLLL